MDSGSPSSHPQSLLLQPFKLSYLQVTFVSLMTGLAARSVVGPARQYQRVDALLVCDLASWAAVSHQEGPLVASIEAGGQLSSSVYSPIAVSANSGEPI